MSLKIKKLFPWITFTELSLVCEQLDCVWIVVVSHSCTLWTILPRQWNWCGNCGMCIHFKINKKKCSCICCNRISTICYLRRPLAVVDVLISFEGRQDIYSYLLSSAAKLEFINTEGFFSFMQKAQHTMGDSCMLTEWFEKDRREEFSMSPIVIPLQRKVCSMQKNTIIPYLISSHDSTATVYTFNECWTMLSAKLMVG